VVETVFHAWDHFQQIDPWIAWLDNISPGQLADPALELQVASTMTAALTMRGGDPHSMERWARRAIAALDAVKEIYPRLGAIVYCTNYLAWVQPPGLDSAMIETTLRDAECADLPPILRLTAIYTRAALALRHTPDMRVVLEEVRAALALADATGVHVWDEILFGLGVHCTLVLGERGAAESFLERMRQSVSAERRQGLAFFHYVNAWSHLVFGAVGEAREAIRKALHLYAQTGYEFPSNVAHYGAAVIYAECGELDSALAHAHRADETAKRYRAHAMRYSTLLILAYVHHKRGEPAEASTALGAALRIGRQGGHYLTLWWWYAPMMSTLAELALREGIESDHAVELVRRMGLEPADPSRAPQAWPWAVAINTLGRFELRVDGKPLDMGKKAGQKPLALLKLLCASNPEGVMTSRVADRLWPDAEGDKAQHALEMALHRLRKLLRRDEAIELRGGWLRLATSLCRVDAHAFAVEVDSGLQCLAAGRHSDARDTLSRGHALYRGGFLGDEGNESWVLPARERLATKFLTATEALGLLYEGEGELERALALYRRTLELDGRSEPLRRRYIRYCRLLGREAEATAAEMYSRQTTDIA
jgi:DNA-binding SARP family transcriptional activator